MKPTRAVFKATIVIVGLFIIGTVTFRSISLHGKTTSSVSTPLETTNSTTTVEQGKEVSNPVAPTFDDKQDDTLGYDGVPWGSSIVTFQKVLRQSRDNKTNSDQSSEENSDELDLSAGPTTPCPLAPYADCGAIGDLLIMKLLMGGVENSPESSRASVAAKFQTMWLNGTSRIAYVFYDNRFAMAAIEVDPNNYEAISNKFSGQYGQSATIDENWRDYQGDSESLTGDLFKRGETNTRVYLLKQGILWGQSSTIIYIPNHYYNEIRADAESIREQEKKKLDNDTHEQLKRDMNRVQ
jgi:hypothetical protein